jgi:hypothetical protein
MSVGLILAAAISASLPTGAVLPTEQATYDAQLATAARAADTTFAGSVCDGARVEVVSIAPWEVLDHPGLIVWRERVRVTGCGRSSIENVNVGRFGGDPPWRMTTGLPGESLADMTLQQSTFQAAAAEARTGLPADCQGHALGDIYVAARPGGVDITPAGVAPPPQRNGHPSVTLPDSPQFSSEKLSPAGAWMEVWPFTFCGHDRTLGVVFIPLKDQNASLYLFMPVWQQIEAHGPGARPAAAQ